MSSMDLEKRVDEIFTEYALAINKNRDKYIESLINDSSEAKRTPAITTSNTTSKSTWTGKRIASLVAILILIFALSVGVVEAAKRILYNGKFIEHNDHAEVLWGDNEEESKSYKGFEVTYIPDGYKLQDEEVENFDGQVHFFKQYALGDKTIEIQIAPREYLKITFDNETTLREVIEFEGKEAIHHYNDVSEFYTDALNWTDGTYEYMISGYFENDEELFKVARGIKGIE